MLRVSGFSEILINEDKDSKNPGFTCTICFEDVLSGFGGSECVPSRITARDVSLKLICIRTALPISTHTL